MNMVDHDLVELLYINTHYLLVDVLKQKSLLADELFINSNEGISGNGETTNPPWEFKRAQTFSPIVCSSNFPVQNTSVLSVRESALRMSSFVMMHPHFKPTLY